jgi:hypothetical protein
VKNGDTKTVTKFLWWPLTLKHAGAWETRWLVSATIVYCYKRGYDGDQWEPVKFVD